MAGAVTVPDQAAMVIGASAQQAKSPVSGATVLASVSIAEELVKGSIAA
jgi:hypothetical protein